MLVIKIGEGRADNILKVGISPSIQPYHYHSSIFQSTKTRSNPHILPLNTFLDTTSTRSSFTYTPQSTCVSPPPQSSPSWHSVLPLKQICGMRSRLRSRALVIQYTQLFTMSSTPTTRSRPPPQYPTTQPLRLRQPLPSHHPSMLHSHPSWLLSLLHWLLSTLKLRLLPGLRGMGS